MTAEQFCHIYIFVAEVKNIFITFKHRGRGFQLIVVDTAFSYQEDLIY